MHKPPITRICCAIWCALPLLAAAQEGLKPRPQPAPGLTPPSPAAAAPVFLEADRVRGHSEKETEAEGAVRLRRGGQSVFADWLRYDRQQDEVNAAGNVRIEQRGDIVEGERLRYNLDTDRGFMEKPRYTLTPVPATAAPTPGKPRFTDVDARGRAERLLFEGTRQYRAEKAEYTTCEPGNDDWFIRSADLHIDKNRDVGVARDASIVFLGQTIFYSPYLSFSLHQQRKSGFLTPHYGSSSKSGTEITVPYYWNIAPNRDATISPRLLTKRGVLVNNEFRYLEPAYSGEARLEVLPNDRQKDDATRYAMSLQHRQTLPYDWLGALNLQKVSDGTYFTDLSTQINLTSQALLPREGTLARVGTWGRGGVYGFAAQVQRWQTLQPDLLAPITPPYNRQPQLTLTAHNQDVFHSDFDLLGSLIEFDHPTLVNGRRFVAYPSLSMPLQTAFAHFTPKIGAHFTHYVLDKSTTTLPDSTRALPIFSAETGLALERGTDFTGERLIQTLEPKLYYVYVPFRDQSRIPNFDSGVQDVNLATIFAENQFSGHDRINDANQVTLGVTSRLINADTGSERLRVAVAQRYYFQSQRVTVPGVPPRSSQSSTSDMLAALSGTVAPHWTAEVGWQYNTDLSQTQKFNAAARYQPQAGKVLNLAYRNTINSVRQTDISTQWPLTSQWTALARWNFSLLDDRTLEALAGFEYNGGCWVFRVVGHRFATATQQASTSIFLQLELNGVSRIGSNPLDVLRRSIGGYVRQDGQPARPEDRRVPGS
ncbi:MAG: LPS-assembly protein LptD [Betaproteobacteria bacterium]|nr:LPS-assembly protein LptD [Betaproteobacteria bacterium]